jgi:hypothetical protein
MINVRLKDSQLLKDWAYAVRSSGKIPARRAYRHLGQYDHRTFERRFGPWSTVPEVFRKFAQDKPEWADVVALLPVPKAKPVRKPATEPAQNPSHNSAPHFAHNNPATNGDGQPDHQPSSSLPLSKLRHPPLDDRPTYGRPMDFRGLRHEPVNEQGVVLLFGIVAKELGYIVEAVQSAFPDCEAKRQTGPQRWQGVHIEFEFESRNFRDHGHPFTGCDVVVCWRHNWPDHPAQIEILELSTLIKSLPTSEDWPHALPALSFRA